jgi:hypothetical protein
VPFSKSGGTGELEIVSSVERALLMEMVADGSVSGGEFLQNSHATEPLHGSLSSSERPPFCGLQATHCQAVGADSQFHYSSSGRFPSGQCCQRLSSQRHKIEVCQSPKFLGVPWRRIVFFRNLNANLRSRVFVTKFSRSSHS